MTGRRSASLASVLAGLVAIVAAASECAAAQAPPAAPLASSSAAPSGPEPAGRLVQLDAVVTDRHGKPILDLSPDDFEVVEDGVVQKLNAVELRGSASVQRPDEGTGDLHPALTSEDERRAAKESGTRVIAVLLDEFHVTPGAPSDRVREAFLRFLDEQVRPTDLLAVLKPLQSVTDIRFTRDRAGARAAVQSFSGRKGDYEARSEFEKRYIGRAPGAVRSARTQIVLSGVRALTSRVGELGAGRSAIIVVSEGFTPGGDRSLERRIPALQGLIRAASRANVAMYAFDPGLPSGSRDDAEADSSEKEHGGVFLQRIAAETGGEAVTSPADFESALQRVSRDLDAYYLLSYTSSHAGDGRFYDVQVRVKSQRARVRARTGYWAPVRTRRLSRSERRSVPPRVIRRSPLIETWLGFAVAPDGRHDVTFTWIPADARGRAAAALAKPAVVSVKVTTPAGAVLFEGEVGAARAATPGAVREDAAFFEAAPGRIQLDLAIYAADGSQIDQAAQDIDVPDASRADPIILPPHVLSSGSAREFREISSDPAAAPTPAREFRRTERLLVRVPTYSASGAAVTVSVRILNRSGQSLRQIDRVGRRREGITNFDLPLSWLAPGEYAIEVTAASSAGSAKEVVRIRVTG